MVNVVTPTWYLSQPCPVCGQGSALVWLRVRNVSMSRQNVPKRGPVLPTHGESMPTRKAIRLRCYVRLVIPCRLRSSCLRRLNSVKYWPRIHADKRGSDLPNDPALSRLTR